MQVAELDLPRRNSVVSVCALTARLSRKVKGGDTCWHQGFIRGRWPPRDE